jgi:O-succinylbenzoate synthase
VPLRVAFRGVTAREAVLLHGPAGWGEFASFVEYDDLESARWLASAIESAWRGHPPPIRDRVSVNATVPAVAPEAVPDVLARFPGCTTAKVKVAEQGQSIGDDVARVAEVRTVLGPHGAIRVDANGAWDVETAVAAIKELDRAARGLEYVEQPCATVEELAAVRRRLDVPIAADESIRRAEDPYRVRDLEAADVAVLKVQPLGGVRACLQIAHDIEMPVVVSSALETSLGLAAGVALAAALPELEHACGLATRALLTGDIATPELVPVDGALSLGVPTVAPELLDAVAAPPERVSWWEERMAAVLALRGGDRA